jgi:hypothetical protein
MVWFNFTDDFNWRASKRGMRQFKAGQRVNVPRECAARAEVQGKGHTDAAVQGDGTGEALPEIAENAYAPDAADLPDADAVTDEPDSDAPAD